MQGITAKQKSCGYHGYTKKYQYNQHNSSMKFSTIISFTFFRIPQQFPVKCRDQIADQPDRMRQPVGIPQQKIQKETQKERCHMIFQHGILPI